LTKVLVTGGLGFIGRALSEKLLHSGNQVRILDNQLRGDRQFLDHADDYEILIGDIRDPAVVERAVAGCSEIYHLAAINGTKNFYAIPRQVLEVGIIGTHLLLDTAIRHGISRLLFMSSSEVYQTPQKLPTDEEAALCVPDPLNPRYSYGGSKIAGELMTVNYCREAIEKAIIVRPHNVYGPDMGFDHVVPDLALKILHARRQSTGSGPIDVPLQGDGSATRAFVYISDFIEGALTAMSHGKHLQIYHVGTEDEVSILELAQRIAAALGISARFIPSEAPSGQTMRRCPDIARIRALGYSPKVPLERGLELALASVRKHFDETCEPSASISH